jgi:hypothetical protein
MTNRLVSLETLYARFDAFARGRARGGHGTHEAVLERLTANQRVAEAAGWTSCALARAAGMGRLRAWGVPPGEGERRPIPDWSSDAASRG